jgi:hypothetical protein
MSTAWHSQHGVALLIPADKDSLHCNFVALLALTRIRMLGIFVPHEFPSQFSYLQITIDSLYHGMPASWWPAEISTGKFSCVALSWVLSYHKQSRDRKSIPFLALQYLLSHRTFPRLGGRCFHRCGCGRTQPRKRWSGVLPIREFRYQICPNLAASPSQCAMHFLE